MCEALQGGTSSCFSVIYSTVFYPKTYMLNYYVNKATELCAKVLENIVDSASVEGGINGLCHINNIR